MSAHGRSRIGLLRRCYAVTTLVSERQEKNRRQPSCGAHFRAHNERTSAVLCAQDMAPDAEVGQPLHRTLARVGDCRLSELRLITKLALMCPNCVDLRALGSVVFDSGLPKIRAVAGLRIVFG